MTGPILIGTASWTDHAPFYPKGIGGSDRLALYAEHVPYVEIDSSFYRIPPARVTDIWARGKGEVDPTVAESPVDRPAAWIGRPVTRKVSRDL